MNANVLSPIRWRGDSLALLDQRLLPHREEEVICRDAAAVAEAIATMVVRGAPAIGIAAAWGLALEAIGGRSDDGQLAAAARRLLDSRPTAVNLRWAVERMLSLSAAIPREQRAAALVAEAERIHAEDIAANRALGALGAELLADGASVLTHCNAGALATGGWGTALGVIRSAITAGKRIAVWADETRPWLQGARLTAWELARDGIDVTLIADDMAGALFRRNTFDAVVVGADRIAANGDVANKIGTYTVAVLAAAHAIPFYVAAPVSTIDLRCPSGEDIPIETRDPAEVRSVAGMDEDGVLRTVRVAAEVPALHLAFDVTPAALVTAIITERGICRAPYAESLARAATAR